MDSSLRSTAVSNALASSCSFLANVYMSRAASWLLAGRPTAGATGTAPRRNCSLLPCCCGSTAPRGCCTSACGGFALCGLLSATTSISSSSSLSSSSSDSAESSSSSDSSSDSSVRSSSSSSSDSSTRARFFVGLRRARQRRCPRHCHFQLRPFVSNRHCPKARRPPQDTPHSVPQQRALLAKGTQPRCWEASIRRAKTVAVRRLQRNRLSI